MMTINEDFTGCDFCHFVSVKPECFAVLCESLLKHCTWFSFHILLVSSWIYIFVDVFQTKKLLIWRMKYGRWIET